jgi:serine O-acetyltransferase
VSKASDAVRHRHPRLLAALAADVAFTLQCRAEPVPSTRWGLAAQALRLGWASDAFAAQCCYRARCSLLRAGVPVLPAVLHRLAMVLAQVCIGDPVVIAPGLYIAHGQVVVDGLVNVGTKVVLFPHTTIGLVAGVFQGPTIGDGVSVGSGARILGPVTIGDGAVVGANAVVIADVPAGATAVGIPARVVERPGT